MNIAITSTRDFFRSISRNFVSWTLNETSLLIISAISFFICISLVVYFFLNRAAQKRAKKKVFTLTEPSVIQTILQQALEDRSSFQVSLNPESAYSLKCSLNRVSSKAIELELPGYIKSLRQQILKRPVYVTFSIPYKKQRVFYFFSSRIINFYKKEGAIFLVIAFPSALELRQKRNFLRIEVVPDDFVDFMVWKEKFLSSGALVDSLPKLGVPVYKKREGSFFPVVDISGLGIKLRFPKNYLMAFVEKELERGDGFIIYMKIKDERRNKTYLLLLHGIIRNVLKDPFEKYIEYGIQFINRGKYNEEKKVISWEKIDPKTGVRELADWVMQKHLYYFRKGIT